LIGGRGSVRLYTIKKSYMKVNGKWIGQYTYGKDYPENIIGKSIAFEINVISKGLEYYGNFNDDETRDIFEDNGIVSGFVEGDYILMEKQYPKAWQIYDNGKIEILDNVPPPLIKYEGAFLNDEFVGEWEIQEYYKEEDETVFFTVVGTGTWSMRKVENI
jgi:hypothetical protein